MTEWLAALESWMIYGLVYTAIVTALLRLLFNRPRLEE